MAKITRNITIDPDVWDKAGEMLKAVGLNRSAFIEITFRSFVKVDKVPIMEVFQGVLEGLQDAQKTIAPIPKRGAVKKKKTKG